MCHNVTRILGASHRSDENQIEMLLGCSYVMFNVNDCKQGHLLHRVLIRYR
jgi:hypothetical protein